MGNSQCQSSKTSRPFSDFAHITEAHGLVTEMLTDQSLPPHIASGLRAVASLLSTRSPSISYRPKIDFINNFSFKQFSSNNEEKEPPYSGNTSTYISEGSRSIPPSLLRRMSTATWSTTTSATGLPNLEPEPLRRRSTNFRAASNLSNLNINNSRLSENSPKNQSISSNFALPSFHPPGIFCHKYNKKQHNQITQPSEGQLSPQPVRANCENKKPKENIISQSIYCNQLMKKSIPRLNLTSDYDSSNESPSGSETTVDDNVTTVDTAEFDPNVQKKIVNKRTNQSVQEIEANKNSANDNASKLTVEKRPEIWTNTYPPEPLTPVLDEKNRYIIDNISYDLEQLANDKLLNLIHQWDYPIFELSEAAGDTILSQLSYKVFLETGLFDTFKIPIMEFLKYFRALENGYRDKPYHNKIHAADVLHGVYYLTSQQIPGFVQIPVDSNESPLQTSNKNRISKSYVKNILPIDESYGVMRANFPALEMMALYTASAMHDYDHPGRTNAFLVSTFSPQAILYNDRSVLENHHAAAAWSLFMHEPSYNWLRYLDKAEFKRFRFLVIELILATDLKRHFEILAEFNAKVSGEGSSGIDWLSELDRLLVMEIVIKLADINGPCKEHGLHLKWTHRIVREFHEQGDEEERLGLPISPFMNKKVPQLAKLQESFINHLVAPLCNSYCEAGLLPGMIEIQEVEAEKKKSPDNKTSGKFFVQKIKSSPADVRKSKHYVKKVVYLASKHLKDNYEFWTKILKQEQETEDEKKKRSSKFAQEVPEIVEEVS